MKNKRGIVSDVKNELRIKVSKRIIITSVNIYQKSLTYEGL